MKYFISTLVASVYHQNNNFDEVARTINDWQDDSIGAEMVAFTHDANYWQRLNDVLPALTCPLTCHGPWIGTEVTAAPESEDGKWLIAAYQKVFDMAQRYKFRHVVVHYSQLHFADENSRKLAQQHAYSNLETLLNMAHRLGVNMVIENLCQAPSGLHLFTNEEYEDIFKRFPEANAIIDIGHANVNGLDVERFLATYGERVTSFHLHNNDGKNDNHCDIHNGTYDVPQFMKWAKKYTPEANMVLEYEPHVNKTLTELREEIEELKCM